YATATASDSLVMPDASSTVTVTAWADPAAPTSADATRASFKSERIFIILPLMRMDLAMTRPAVPVKRIMKTKSYCVDATAEPAHNSAYMTRAYLIRQVKTAREREN